MRCLTLGLDRTLKYDPDHDRPVLSSANDVIIQVEYTGICGTDHSLISGVLQTELVILGHEIVGVVFEIGDEVTTLSPGLWVCVDPNSYCSKCRYCKTGNRDLCDIDGLSNYLGISKRNGGFAEFVSAPADRVHVLPAILEGELGVMCEPFACVISAVSKAAPMKSDTRALVIGAGIAGIQTCFVLFKHFGVGDITVINRGESRRNVVNYLGIPGCRAVHPDVVRDEEATDSSRGFDVAIDCSGNASAIEEACSWLRKAGTLIVYGIGPAENYSKIDPVKLCLKELTIKGSVIYNNDEFSLAIQLVEQLVREDGFTLSKIGGEIFSLDQFEKAFRSLKSGEISKAVFKIGFL